MPNLDQLLNTPIDNLDEAEVPAGTYHCEAFMAKLTDPKEDKNGRPFVQAMVGLNIVEPYADAGDVDPQAWDAFVKADGLEDAAVFFKQFVSRPREAKSLLRLLSNAGVPVKGRSLSEVLDELKGGGYRFLAVVSIDEEYGPQVDSLLVDESA